jgi:hypothetical protein
MRTSFYLDKHQYTTTKVHQQPSRGTLNVDSYEWCSHHSNENIIHFMFPGVDLLMDFGGGVLVFV